MNALELLDECRREFKKMLWMVMVDPMSVDKTVIIAMVRSYLAGMTVAMKLTQSPTIIRFAAIIEPFMRQEFDVEPWRRL